MKIRPEFSENLVKDRFSGGSKDTFKRRELIERIVRLNENIDQGFTAILDGRWGAGKTTFVRALREEMVGKSIPCIYFNAFENDYASSAFEILASTFFDAAKSVGGKGSKRYKDFVRATGGVFKVVGLAGAKVFAKAATLGALDGSEVNDLKELLSDGVGDIAEKSEEQIEKILETRANSEKSFMAFRQSVQKIAEWHRSSNGDGNFLVIVDELDRCRPDFALDVIEVIKHLFSVSHVNFILVANFDALVTSVSHRYGLEERAAEYLEKFYDFRIFFGVSGGQAHNLATESFVYDVLSELIEHKSLIDDLNSYLSQIAIGFDLSLRDIEKFAASISLVYASKSDNENINCFILCYCLLLKIKFPAVYLKLKRGVLRYSEIKSVIDHGHLKNEYQQENFDRVMRYHFDPDIDVNRPEWQGFSSAYWGTNRLDIFKNYANNVVDRFAR